MREDAACTHRLLVSTVRVKSLVCNEAGDTSQLVESLLIRKEGATNSDIAILGDQIGNDLLGVGLLDLDLGHVDAHETVGAVGCKLLVEDLFDTALFEVISGALKDLDAVADLDEIGLGSLLSFVERHGVQREAHDIVDIFDGDW